MTRLERAQQLARQFNEALRALGPECTWDEARANLMFTACAGICQHCGTISERYCQCTNDE